MSWNAILILLTVFSTLIDYLLLKMAFLDNDGGAPSSPILAVCLALVILAHLVGVRLFDDRHGRPRFPVARFPFRAAGYAVVILILMLLAPAGVRPFIYFQF